MKNIKFIFIFCILIQGNILADRPNNPSIKFSDFIISESLKKTENSDIFIKFLENHRKYHRDNYDLTDDINFKGGVISEKSSKNNYMFNYKYLSITNYLKEVDSFIYLERFA